MARGAVDFRYPHHPTQLLARVRAPRDEQLDSTFELLDFTVRQTPVIPDLGVVHLDVPAIPNDSALHRVAENLRHDSRYEFVEPNYCTYLEQGQNDTKRAEQWALGHVRAPDAWQTGVIGSKNVVVAVIDSGVEGTDPEFDGRLRAGKNFVGPPSDTADGFGHGTQVSGIIGAVHGNGECIQGLNQKISIMPLKVTTLDTGYVSDVIDAIKHATDKKVDIINLSWTTYASYSLFDAIEKAGKAQIVVAAAAGHGGTSVDLDTNPSYPCFFRLSNVICVAGTFDTDQIEPLSSWGDQTVHLGAPGHEIVGPILGNGCVARSGPSLAAPHVAGVAALIRAKCENASVDEVISRIRDGGVQRAPLVGRTIWGRRLDAFGAVSPPCWPRR